VSIFNSLREASRQIELDQKREAYRTDIKLWAWERLGITIWSKQVEIAEALVKYKKVAVKSCHASGKSFTASLIIAWWVDTRVDKDAIVVSTAPTYEQVNKILWEYLRGHMGLRDADGNTILPGKITQEDEWKDSNGRILGFGRKPSDTNVHGFQGVHRRDGVLAVLDEACGIAKSLWVGVQSITTGKNDCSLAIANPDDPNTHLGRIFADPDNGWHKITISAFDTPNFTDEWKELPEEVCAALVSQRYVDDMARDWGVESPIYQSKVLGQFPKQGINQLFSSLTLSAGCNADVRPLPEVKPVLGVDVARFGGDYTVVYINQNGKLRLLDSWSKVDLVETAERVVKLAIRHGVSEVRIDGVGIGAGVWDMVARMSEDRWKTIGLLGNNRSPDLDVWANYRAYAYDTFRSLMARGQIDIDFEDRTLYQELEGIQYKFNSRGAIQIESKDEMIKRGMKSPDFADAAMYAVAPLLVDPQDPLSTFSENDEISFALEDMLMEEELQISPM